MQREIEVLLERRLRETLRKELDDGRKGVLVAAGLAQRQPAELALLARCIRVRVGNRLNDGE
jgi:hypothetical protein